MAVPDQAAKHSVAQPAGLRFFPFVLAFGVVVADQLTKFAIQRQISSFDSISVLPGTLRIVHTENPGAAFGVLAEGNPLVRTFVLIGVSAAVLLFVASALWSRRSSFTSLSTRLGLALILGGAIGNLYDRILRGTVTDFIEVYHGTWTFPAFNVADSAITVGACLVLLEMFWPKRPQVREKDPGLVHK